MPQPHVATSNDTAGHHPPCQDRIVEGTPVCLATPGLPADDGIDLLDMAMVLIGGWKIIVGLMILAALVGAMLVSWKPSPYRASTVLRVQPPDQSAAPRAASAFAAKIDPAVLQHYADQFCTEDSLQQAAERAGLSGPDAPAGSLNQVRAAVAVQPAKDSSQIEVSATLDTPAQAERLVEALAEVGLASVERARRQGADALRDQLREQRDKTLEVFRQTRDKRRDFCRERQIEEKRTQLQALSRQANAIQQVAYANQARIPELEARVECLQELIQAAPRPDEETDEGTLRLAQIAQLCERLTIQLDMPPLVLAGLDAALRQGDSRDQWPQELLAKDQLALRGAQHAVQTNRAQVQPLLQEMANLQFELSDAEGELELLQWNVDAARKAYLAAEDALRQSAEQIDQEFPVLALAGPPQTSVRQAGSSRFGRLLLLQLGAFMLGCLVVLIRSAHDRRTATRPPATGQALPGMPVCLCQATPQERMSA